MTGTAGVEGLLRDLAPRVLAVLLRSHGDFEACEDAVQEALLAAAVQWPADGVPANPRRVAGHRRVAPLDEGVAQRHRPPAPGTHRRNCERDVLADHLPVLRGRSRHEFDVDVPLGNITQPRALVQGTDISRGSAPEHIRPVPVGWRHHRLGRDCLHGDCRPRVFPGPAHTDEQRRPPGLSTRAPSAVALATSGKNMYPKRTETLSNVAWLNAKSSALHTFVSILATPCALARRAAMSSISATRSVSMTRPFSDSLAMLKPGSPVPEAMSRC
jgi:hypothetical protein